MRNRDEPEPPTIREAFAQLGVDELKPLAALVQGKKQGRKAELIDLLAGVMENQAEVRALYDGLDELAKKAIQEVPRPA